jgi:hypothetical protein
MVRIPNRRAARPGVLVAASALVAAGSLLLAACSSGPSGSGGNPVKQITANWTAFFKGTTPATKKTTLLQNGSQFAKTSTGRSVSVKVTKVKVTSSTSAKVTYTILLGGTPQLSGASGTAVLQNGKWKVSDASFCALLSLQGTASQVNACAKT